MASISSQAKKVVSKIPQKQDFTKLYGTFQNYWGGQSPLAQEAIRTQLEKQFEPQITQGIGNLKTDFARRNLSRSGMRVGAENNYLSDVADQFGTQAEQLLAQRKNEASSLYNEQQRLYEKSPVGFKSGLTPGNANYQVATPTAQQGIGNTYGGAGTYQSSTGAPSYLQAYRDYLKRTSGEFNKKYYGA